MEQKKPKAKTAKTAKTAEIDVNSKKAVGSWNATLRIYEPADKKNYSETVIYKEPGRKWK